MALWICLGSTCGTAYSVGAPKCPQCGGTARREDSDEPVDAQPAPPAATQVQPSAASSPTQAPK